MATLALTAIGSAAGASIFGEGIILAGLTGAQLGASIGGLAGSVIDSLVLPGLFNRGTSLGGNRIDEMRLPSASLGADIYYLLGKQNRVPCHPIWVSDLLEEKVEEDQGGKGGGGVTTTSYRYSVDIAILIGESDGPIQRVDRIFANGQTIYYDEIGQGTNEINYSSNLLSAERHEVGVPGNPAIVYLRIVSPSGGPDMTAFQKGADVDVDGWTATDNNGTFRCAATGTGSGGSTWVDFLNFNAVDEAAGNTITMYQFKERSDASLYENITIYLGTEEQEPDPTIESYEGAGNVEAYRGRAYVVIEGFQLENFGNQIPRFEALAVAHETLTAAEAITKICARNDLVLGTDFSITGLTDLLLGYPMAGVKSLIEQLEPLIVAYNVDMREIGLMEFYARGTEPEIEVDRDDLAAHEFGTEKPQPVVLTRPPKLPLPTRMSVTSSWPERRWQNGTVSERLGRESQHKNTASISIDPLVFSEANTRKIARRMLWTAWQDRQPGEVQLPPSYQTISEGVILPVTDANDEVFNMRVRRLREGVNGIIVAEGVVEDAEAEAFEGADDNTFVDDDVLYVPPIVLLVVMDIPALRYADAESPGLYFGFCAVDINAVWNGSRIFESDDDTTFGITAAGPFETVIGEAEDVLGDVEFAGHWDEINSVTVRVYHGTLSSATADEVLAGANRAKLGTEIIGFRTATLVAANTYELSGLLRGRLDTWDTTGDHAVGDVFCLLSSTLVHDERELTDVGATRYFRGVAEGDSVANVASVSLTYNAQTMRPFAPIDIDGSRDISNNLTITWVRSARVRFTMFEQTAPLLEGAINYEVDVLNGGGSVVRTLTSMTEAVEYTAAEQTVDGFTPGNPIDVIVYQLDKAVGRGKGRTATV